MSELKGKKLKGANLMKQLQNQLYQKVSYLQVELLLDLFLFKPL